MILVPDGMADHPVKELGGRTPVEAADTPNMDLVAREGVCGMAQTFYRELPYDSSIANMGIMGYDPRRYFSGRAPLEAANLGVELCEGDVALRCNLVTAEDGRMKDFTAGHIGNAEARRLMEELDRRLGGDGVEFYPGVSYRNLLVIRSNRNPSVDFTTTQPHDIVGEETVKHAIKPADHGSAETVALLNRLAEDAAGILEEHEVNMRRTGDGENPANRVWFWGAGTRPDMPPFQELYGLRGSLVSAVDLLNGLARTIGLEVLEVEGVTGYLDTNYEGKADAAVDSLKEVDLTYVHVESTDEAGHEGSVEHKIRAIEDVDRRVLGRVLDGLDGDYAVLVIPDHPTPIEVRTHTNEPVPYALYDTRRKGDAARSYSERGIKENGSRALTEAWKLIGEMTKGL